jgi:hypothetical protein
VSCARSASKILAWVRGLLRVEQSWDEVEGAFLTEEVRNPNSPDEDWVEYETGNVTLAVVTPRTHGYEFTPLPPGTIALRVPDVAEAKAKLEAAGVQANEA